MKEENDWYAYDEIFQRKDKVEKEVFEAKESEIISFAKTPFGPVQMNDIVSISMTPSSFESFLNGILINSVSHSLDLSHCSIIFENSEQSDILNYLGYSSTYIETPASRGSSLVVYSNDQVQTSLAAEQELEELKKDSLFSNFISEMQKVRA